VPTEVPATTRSEPAQAVGARLLDELRRVPPWGWALLFAIVLCLPRLARFGFWDPWELKLAEQARDIARAGHFFDATAGGKYPGGHALAMLLSALGITLFGASELGARLPIALSAVGALMAVYWAGRSLLRPRAALLATLTLGSMPLFVLEARQLTSDAPLIATLALALGALGRFAWPPNGRRRGRDIGVALVSVALGIYAGGALLGFVLPVLSIVAALIIGYGLNPNASDAAIADGTGPLAAPGVGRDVPTDRSLGASTLHPGARTFWPFAVLGLAAVALLIFAMTHLVAGKYSWLLGGVPRAGAPTKTFEALIRQLGFGLFPWSAVAIFALARPLTRLDGDGGGTNTRLAFVSLYLLIFAGTGFALCGYLNVVQNDVRYVALPAIALAIGAFLDEALEGNGAEPVAGLLMGIGTLIIARDFFLAPEELASVHVNDKVKWPAALRLDSLFLWIGVITASGVYSGLAARPRAVGKAPGPDRTNARQIWRRLDRVALAAGRYGLQIAVACAVVFALFLAQFLVPRLSTHLSFKPVLESYTKFAQGGEKIGKYRIEGHGSTFYSKQTMVELPSQDRVVQFLRDPARVFAMVPTDELAALDAAFKQAHVGYHVVDASSSRFLLITNQLGPGQRDDNPLANNVWTAPAGDPNAKPPWSWRVPVSATFGDAIELVGADFPQTVRRPGKIPLDLYFRIKAKVPGSYKIFVHFDGPAAPRVIGDHDPVNHAFGTNFWLPDEYIRDHYDTDVPLMTTPAGTYTVLVGFWPGGEGKRLKVTQGNHDGADRVRLGTIEIK
jgi:dolichyl-phosphate-mannose-protein mannosyltransferase